MVYRTQESQTYPSASTPTIPWPVPYDETIFVELCRWYHGPTQRQDGFFFVYFIRLLLRKVRFIGRWIELQGARRKFFVADERWQDDVWFYGYGEAILQEEDSEKVPANVVQEFERVSNELRIRAEKEESRYDRSVDSAW